MPRSLEVECFGRTAGRLTDRSPLAYAYDPSWLADGLPPLSQSLPLTGEFAPGAVEAFFDGLLPEGTVRRTLARILGVSEGNAFSLLERTGGDTAGALSFHSGDEPRRAAPTPVTWLADDEFVALVKDLPRRPMHAGPDGRYRLSLAGTQDKLPVVFEGGRVGLTDGVIPSTHILKLPLPELPASVLNEALWARVGARLGITCAPSTPFRVRDVDVLLVTRYDREPGPEGVRRLHQEDFCQALGIPSDRKYENEGGPGLADCFALAREAATVPATAIVELLDMWALSFIAGNHDAHGKNFSLLYRPDGVGLAPAYDVLSSWVYDRVRPMDRRMAMKVGGENRPDYVRRRHLERMFVGAGLGSAPARRRLRGLARRAPAVIEDEAQRLQSECWPDPFVAHIVALGRRRAEQLATIVSEAP